MPVLGEIKRAKDLGKNVSRRAGYVQYIWDVCPDCGQPRWVQKYKTRRAHRCCICNRKFLRGDKSPNFKGGRVFTREGYTRVWLSPDSFYHSMVNKCGYIMEHRLVMAKYLGRCLFGWEVVHHKNGIKDDNRLENLELSTKNAHTKDHNLGYRDDYEKGLADGRKQARIESLKAIGQLAS